MHDSHSLMLTARAQRRAASLCLSLVLFSITPSNIWTLQSQEGEEDSWQWARQLLSARGFNSLSCREDWVCRRGKGWGGVSWVCEEWWFSKKGNWREVAHQYPVMAASENYCNRNAEITQGRLVYFLAFLIHAGQQLGKSLLDSHLETGAKSRRIIYVSGPLWIE